METVDHYNATNMGNSSQAPHPQTTLVTCAPTDNGQLLQKPNEEKFINRACAVHCDGCGITLNSEMQAQQHFSGRGHLRKMKQLGIALSQEDEEKIKPKMTPLPQTGGAGGMPVQEYTPQNPVYGNQGQGHNQVAVDPVGQAVIDNMMGNLPTRKRKLELPCTVCDLVFNSEFQADAHFSGGKHSKKLKTKLQAQEIMEADHNVAETVTDGPKITKVPCNLCNIVFNSMSQAEAHFNGAKHRRKLEAKELILSGKVPEIDKPAKTPSPSPVKEKFNCEMCNLSLNSATQLEAHLTGVVHKKKLVLLGQSSANSAMSSAVTSLTKAAPPLLEYPGHVSGMFYCRVCVISVRTAIALQQHMATAKHQDRLLTQKGESHNSIPV